MKTRSRRRPARPDAASDLIFAQRIRQAMGGLSQSELSRKTGVPQQYINRYLRGSKIPLGFAEALVRVLDVNPAWLLTGEGAPRISDVTRETADTGTNLLALVRAMSAISKMKLGALTGKEHAKVLRELSDAMVEYEKLRERLDEQTRPLLKSLVDKVSSLLTKDELPRAREPLEAARQLSRICYDEKLRIKLDRLDSFFQWWEGNARQAFPLLRRSLFNSVITQEGISTEDLYWVRSHILHLRNVGELLEAKRMCKAMLALYENLADDVLYRRIAIHEGYIDIGLGRLHDGLAKMFTNYAMLDENARDLESPIYVRNSLLAGAMSIDNAMRETIAVLPRSGVVHQNSIIDGTAFFALWLGKFECLNELVKFLKTEEGNVLDGSVNCFFHSVLTAHQGDSTAYARYKRTPVVQQAHELDSKQVAAIAFVFRPWVCGLACLCSQWKAAYVELLETDKLLVSIPPSATPNMLAAALHYRNAYKIAQASRKSPVPPDLLRRAADFFERHVAAGYRIFADDAREATAVAAKLGR